VEIPRHALAQARRARSSTLQRFFHEHNIRFEKVLASRLEAIKTATPLTLDNAIIMPHRMIALVLVEQLQLMLNAIKVFDTEIDSIAKVQPDYELFRALPGAGPSLAPRLLVAFEEQRDRFTSAEDVQKYAGIAPVTERSGKKHWVHWRWQCSKFLRQTFVEWAAQTINKSYWAGAFTSNSVRRGAPIRRQ
jgi:transposase